MDMVIDKMYFRNHVDKWCKANCNPYDRSDLDGVSNVCFDCVGQSSLHMAQTTYTGNVLFSCNNYY